MQSFSAERGIDSGYYLIKGNSCALQKQKILRFLYLNELILQVAPGLELGKYVSTGTDLADNKCGLLVNGEFSIKYHGLWRLEMGLTSGRTIGGFINMPEGTKPGPNGTQK